MPSIRAVAIKLPHVSLVGANWADCFETEIHDRRLTAIEAARLTLGQMPPWVRRLMATRNALGRVVGLKTGSEPLEPNQKGKIGVFPILSSDDREVILGFDDWHLDFRVIVEAVDQGDQGTRLRTTTLVRRKNLFGHFYIGLVTPFHKLIVRNALSRAA